MTITHLDNVLLLDEKHIGSVLTAYNFDLVVGYDHSVMHRHESWTLIMQEFKAALSDDVKAKMKQMLAFEGLTKNQRKFLTQNRHAL